MPSMTILKQAACIAANFLVVVRSLPPDDIATFQALSDVAHGIANDYARNFRTFPRTQFLVWCGVNPPAKADK